MEIIKIYIVYEINKNVNISSYPMLENCLFGAVKLTKHVDINQYKYSGYGMGLDKKGFLSNSNEIGRNIIIFGVDMSSSPHIDNKEKGILIFGKEPTQELENTLNAEKLYSINFTKNNTKFCLSFHCNGANSNLFANGTEIIKLKVKDSEIVAYPLCLGKISRDFSEGNMKKTGLKGSVYDFSVDYNATSLLIY